MVLVMVFEHYKPDLNDISNDADGGFPRRLGMILLPSVVPKEVPKEVPSVVPKEVPSVVPKEVPSVVPIIRPS